MFMALSCCLQTDSLVYEIETDNFYDPANKKVIGKMENEVKIIPVDELVGLKSKV